VKIPSSQLWDSASNLPNISSLLIALGFILCYMIP
jgi:hypothetical protein